MFVSMTKFSKTLCLAILVLACAAIVPAMAQTVTYTNGEIYNAPNINTDSYDTVYFVITDSSLHSYPRNLSGGGLVDYTGKNVNYYLKLTGDNSAFSGTMNVHNSDTHTGLYFASTNAGFSQGTLILGDKCYTRTAMSTDATVPIGALEGTGFIRNDESSGHTITYQLGGANVDATFSGQIMNTYKSDVDNYPTAIEKVGTGTQTLAGNNTYSGGTTITEGTLKLSGAGTLGSGKVENNAVLEFAHDTKQTVSNAISGTGTIKKTGSGELVLNDASAFKGKVNVTNGTLTLAKAGQTGTFPKECEITVDGANAKLSGTGTVLGYGAGSVGRINLYNGGSLNVSSDDGHITVGGALYLNGGKLTTTNPNAAGDTYGNFIIDNGIHVTGSTDNEIAVSKITIRSDGHTENGGYFDVAENARLTVSAVIRPNSAVPVEKYGLGELVFKAANTYTGETRIKAGTLRLTDNGTLGDGTGAVTVTPASDDASATLEFAHDTKQTVSNYISGTGTINKTGAGELVLNDASGFKGQVNVTDGTLTITKTGGTGTFAKESVITVEGSTAVLSGSGTILGYGSTSVSRLNLNDGGSINVTSGHITMGGVTYLNDGKFTITNPDDQGDTYGNYIIDNGIHVTGGTANAIDANRISIRNDGHTENGGLFDVAENAVLTVNAVIFDSPFADNKRPNVIKKGEGVLVFTAANTYSKDTIVEAGTLKLTENGTLGSGSLTVMDGAVVDVSELTSGAPISVSSLTMNENSTLKLTLTKSGNDWTVSSPFDVDAATLGGNIDLLLTGDEVTLDDVGILGTFISSDSPIAGAIASINLDELSNLLPESTYLYFKTSDDGTLGQIALGLNGGGEGVPEPSTRALLILGAMGLLFFKKRVNNK